MSRSKIETIILLIVTAVILIATHIYTLLYTPASTQARAVTVGIPRGVSFMVVANYLAKEGLLKDVEGFVLAASLRGAYKKIQAGEYEFSPSMTPVEMIDILTSGRIKQYSVTIPEGYNIRDTADALERTGLAKREEFIGAAMDRKFTMSLGMEAATLEGYLFPDTYIFTKAMSVEEMIGKMVERFRDIYEKEFRQMAEKKGMKMRQVVTLASIIEKETGRIEEMAEISAVFHNRLKKRIPLQSDPTVIYALANFDGNLKKEHLLRRTPYNTYRFYGLPPGPIANPGRAAIQAAINPSAEGHLYFVSRNDGTHQFSKSLEEHKRAVEFYQKSLVNRPQS